MTSNKLHPTCKERIKDLYERAIMMYYKAIEVSIVHHACRAHALRVL